MLHVRVVAPPGRTGRLLDTLGGLPGVRNVIVVRGAASLPDGDAVQFDVHDTTANPLFGALREPGFDRDGGIGRLGAGAAGAGMGSASIAVVVRAVLVPDIDPHVSRHRARSGRRPGASSRRRHIPSLGEQNR